MGYRIVVGNRSFQRIGEIDTWISLDFVVEHCDQGSWQLLIKSGTPQAELLQQDGHVAIYQDGVTKPVLTGAIDTIQKWWTVEQHSSEGSVYVGGKTHTALAFTRVAFPEPAKTIPQQYTGQDTRKVSAPAGSAVWDEISKALGAGTVTDRRVSPLNAGTRPTFGGTVTDTLRYDVVGEKLLDWCTTKGVGYRILWNPDTAGLDVDVYQPRDLSKTVRLSPELGNLRQYTWTLTAPKTTRAIVACQGDGKERYIYQKVDAVTEAEWARVLETFVDRRDIPLKTASNGSPALVTKEDSNFFEDIGKNPEGNDWTPQLTAARKAYEDAVAAGDPDTDPEYDAVVAAINAAKPVAIAYWMSVVVEAADAALAEGEKKGNFQVYPIDTPQCLFGRDYFVGDKITVAVDGTEYSDLVRQVTITVDDGGKAHTVSPVIGEQGSGNPLNLYASVWEMRKKLRKLEARM
ncbi:siphovirus ReqiPepy6 Gp37-like family protein [Streptomyces sp. NPDC002644]